MASSGFFTSTELCYSILTLKPPAVAPNSFPEDVIDAVSVNVDFISKNESEIKNLRKILDETQSTVKTLIKIKFAARNDSPLYQSILVLKLSDLDQDGYYVISYVVLYAYLQWTLNTSLDLDMESFLRMMTILDNYCINSPLRKHLISAFINAYTVYTNFTPLRCYEKIQPILFNFLLQPEELPSEAYKSLLKTAESLISAGKQDISKEAKELLSFVDMCYTEKQTQFPQDIIRSILGLLTHAISALELSSFTFFSNFTSRLPESFIKTYYLIFPMSIYKLITNWSPQYEISIDGLPDMKLLEDTREKPMIQFHFLMPQHEVEAVEAIDFETSMIFPERIQLIDILKQDIIIRLGLVLKSASTTPLIDTFFTTFAELFANLNHSPHFVEITAALLYSLLTTEVPYDALPLMIALLDSPLYDPRFNLSNDSKSLKIILSLRSYAFEFLEKNQLLRAFAKRIYIKPLILAEHIHRIIQTQTHFTLPPQEKLKLAKQVLKIKLYYQSVEDVTSGVDIARASIFVLLARMLAEAEFMYEFFKDDYCSTVFVSFLFEAPLKQFALRCIRSQLSNAEPPDVNLPMILANAIQVSARSFPSIESLKLVDDILTVINEVVSVRRTAANSVKIIRKETSSILATMAANINGIDDIQLAESIFNQAILFFTNTSSSERTNAANVSAFETAALALFKNGPIPQHFQIKFMQLIAGTTTPSMRPEFIIREPKFVTFYLKCYQETDQFCEIIQFVTDLCGYARQNSIACSIGKVDLFLIEVIRRHKESLAPNNPIIINCLNLMIAISSVISSVAVVQQSISLFTPINKNYVSLYQPIFIKTMADIISRSYRIPQACFPLLSTGPHFNITGFDDINIDEGFTFTFWIYTDSQTSGYTPHILDMNDANGHSLSLTLNLKSFVLKVKSKRVQSTGINDSPISLNNWLFISLSVWHNEEDNTNAAQIAINCTQSHELIFPFMKFSGPITCVIGDNNEVEDVDRPVVMGSFGMFPLLKEDQIAALCEFGPRNKIFSFASLFFYRTINVNNNLVAQKADGLKTIQCRMTGENPKQFSNFADFLLSACKVETLIPLFAQLDMKFIDGSPFAKGDELILELFGSAIVCSIDAQTSLYSSNGIDIIAYLLTIASDQHISYAMYSRFFTLYKSMTYTPLQTQIMNSILFNVPLWSRAKPDHYLLIIRHWARSLFPIAIGNGTANCSFSSVLDIINCYYWDSVPTTNHSSISRDVDITQCRKCLLDIACQIASVRFDARDLNNLLSHCVNIKDTELLIDYVKLLKQLAIMSPSPLTNAGNAQQYMSLILYLLNSRNTELIILTIETFLVLIDGHYLKNTTNMEFIDIIMNQISSDDVTETLFDSLLDLMDNGHPELLPFCSWIAITLDVMKLRDFIGRIEPSPKYCIHNSWCFWLIVITFKVDKEIREVLLSFIIKCGDSQWKKAFVLIGYAGKLLDMPSEHIASEFLFILSDLLLKNELKCDVTIYFDLIFRFICFRSSDEENDSLRCAFKTSPFAIDERISLTRGQRSNSARIFKLFSSPRRRIPSMSQNMYINPILIYEQLKKLEIKPKPNHFGLRFDNKGNWIDQKLAKKFVTVSMIYSPENKLDIVLTIASFLARVDPQDTSSLISSLIIKKIDLPEYTGLVNYESFKANATKPFYYVPDLYDAPINPLENLSQKNVYEVFQLEKSLPKTLKHFYSNNWNKSISILSLINNDKIATLSTETVLKFIESSSLIQKENEKKWQRLWRQLSFNRAPWDTHRRVVEHWKRDLTGASYVVPLKTKRNFKHDNHMDASMARDKASNDEICRATRKRGGSESGGMVNLSDLNDVPLLPPDSKASVILSIKCQIITPKRTLDRTFKLYKSSIKFFDEYGKYVRNIKLEEIKEMYFRKYIHLPTAMEIFMIDGTSLFINFPKCNSLRILSKISLQKIPSNTIVQTQDYLQYFEQNSLLEDWLDRKISNFEYLMHLNRMSGRSFNVLSQYPVFPWIIKDYASEKCSYKEDSFYRDLSKPIGALDCLRFKNLLRQFEEICDSDDEPYMYSSGYVYPYAVISYFIRLEPYTTLNIQAGNGKFENALRIFKSIEDFYKHCSSGSNDYRELVPEFFFFPEFLVNSEKFDLGTLDDGSKVDDVKLPKWAKNPLDFIYKHRLALESEYVSEHLPEWIDLIWGYKQKGEEALQAKNLYKKEMYEDIWEKNPDYDTAEAVLLHVGQIPAQLFFTPHPKRGPKLPITDERMQTLQSMASEISFSYAKVDDNKFYVYLLSKDGRLLTYQFVQKVAEKKNMRRSLTLSNSLYSSRFETSTTTKSIEPTILPENPKFSFIQPNSLAVSQYGSNEILIINFNTGNTSKMQIPLNETSAMTSSDNYFAIAGKNAVVNVFRNTKNHEFVASIPSYRAELPCVAISEPFSLIVNGTRDGFLVISSISKLDITKIVDLDDGRPALVTITPTWGFIVVYLTKIEAGQILHFLNVYSTNGKLISSSKMENRILALESFTSQSGFDFILTADDKGKLVAREAYNLEAEDAFYRLHTQITSITYHRKHSLVIAVTQDGRILLLTREF